MPVYTYRREDGTTFDYRQKFNDEPLTIDPTTGQSVVRLVQAAGIIFKGSGFYVTDSKGSRSNLTNAAKAKSADEAPAASTETAKPAAAPASTTSTAGAAAD